MDSFRLCLVFNMIDNNIKYIDLILDFKCFDNLFVIDNDFV